LAGAKQFYGSRLTDQATNQAAGQLIGIADWLAAQPNQDIADQ
jgi:hypothetical protein